MAAARQVFGLGAHGKEVVNAANSTGTLAFFREVRQDSDPLNAHPTGVTLSPFQPPPSSISIRLTSSITPPVYRNAGRSMLAKHFETVQPSRAHQRRGAPQQPWQNV